MMHTSVDFTEHMLGLLKNTGPSGPTGPTQDKPLKSNEKAGTTRCTLVGPVDIEWSQPARATGPTKIASLQVLTGSGTTGTSGTTNFEQGPAQPQTGGAPSDWYAILAELKQKNCPDWLAPDRWAVMLSDAESFLSRWGTVAHSLGWTALDIFGVHPIVPAARFDIMGLTLLLHGGAVVALTEDAATIRRQSGATLTYPRSDRTGAVCITGVKP